MKKYTYFILGYITALITLFLMVYSFSPLQANYTSPGHSAAFPLYVKVVKWNYGKKILEMGILTKFFAYFMPKTRQNNTIEHMSINKKIKLARQEYLKRKKGNTPWKMHITLAMIPMHEMINV